MQLEKKKSNDVKYAFRNAEDIYTTFKELKISMNSIHDVSHVIKDVLNGMSPKEAIEKNMAENEEDE